MVARVHSRSVVDERRQASAGIGGGLATLVDMGALIALVEAGTPISIAAFVAAMVGGAFCFAWNKYLAFRDRSALAVGQVARYVTVAIATALLMAVGMQLVAVMLGMQYVLAKLVCSLLVFGAWTYPAQRLLVFRELAVEPR